jgi:iron(III) transport system substrate-binding protein
VRDSTGIVTAKLLAEKANPQADVIWGLAATSLALLDKEGMLTPYAPQGLSAIDAKYRSAANPPAWVGMDVCLGHLLQHRGSAKAGPAQADFLGRPDQAGLCRQDRHAQSGFFRHRLPGCLGLAADDGRRKGWAYMDALHKNIGQYTHSGSKPCKQAATGEFPIGIAFEYRAVKTKKEGAPIDVILPAEGLGWDIEATAIVKGSKHLEAAKLADFSASKEPWPCMKRTSPWSPSPAWPSRTSCCRPTTRSA